MMDVHGRQWPEQIAVTMKSLVAVILHLNMSLSAVNTSEWKNTAKHKLISC
jgi:hypothetical protein